MDEDKNMKNKNSSGHKDDIQRISLAVIRRLPRYYRYLGDLLDNGITRISSQDLSVRMNITASQIRQDLNNFGCFGQQGYGYNVELLYAEIKKILGLNRSYNLIIVGAGKIGRAILNYKSFQRRGFNFIGIFDNNPELLGTEINGLKVQRIDEMDAFLKQESVDIVALAVPKDSAVEVISSLQSDEVKGIWNFSPVDLDAPDGILVENVHLTDSIMTLSYRLNEDNIVREYGSEK